MEPIVFTFYFISRNQTIRCSYSYKSTGVFQTTVRVSNSISYIDIPSTDLPVFTVEVPIEDSFINVPDTIEVDQPLELLYSLVAGSNVANQWYIDQELYSEAVYKPQSEGVLNITLRLENNLDSVTLSKTVQVESRLQSVQLDENLGNYHKLTELVEMELVLTPPAEHNVMYEVDMGDGTVYNTSRVSHHYSDIGIYTISISAENNLSSVSLSKQLNVQDEILRVMIRGSFMLLPNQLSTFYAEVYKKSTSKLDDNVSYEWQIDGVVQEQNAPDNSVRLEKIGTHVLTLSVSNAVSSQSVSETLVVASSDSCPPPEARIVGDDHIVVTSVDLVSLEAAITPNCDSKHDVSWSILTLNRVLVTNFTNSRSKALTFRASVIEPGQYIVRLVVFVEGYPDYYRSHEVLLRVDAVHIIPVINYPTFTTTNTKETLHLSLTDSIILSTDMTIDDFVIHWNCRFDPLPTSFDPCLPVEIEESPNISVNFNISGLAYLTTHISSNNRIVATSEIVINVTNYVVPLVKISVENLHQLSPDDRTIASLQCYDRENPCYHPEIYWQVSKVSQSVCENTPEVDTGTFTLSPDMTTTGLAQSNLVVRGGVFMVGGTYKLEGCVWKGVCGGELLVLPCGPSQGACDVGLVEGKLEK